mmetsp:Transcript_17897/g.26407  ORF Transcript_17897/g.26407 Transcript_17897/m.26407 type:complete len:629 (+) Transcript_17897:78-1964(+)
MIAAVWFVLLSVAHGYSLPGVTVSSFREGDHVALKANQVTSTKAQVPFDYYDLPFCKRKHTRGKADNLGERLSGDRETTSPYILRMKQDESCVILCRKNHKKDDMMKFRQMIDQEYRIHWLLDGLPVAVRNDELGYVTRGYPVGFTAKTGSKSHHFLYNHVRIIVRYAEDPTAYEGSRIVGFEVVPFSIKHEYDEAKADFDKADTVLKTCNQFSPAVHNPEKFQGVDSPDEVIYTYDVKWEPSDLLWSNRWDVYLKGNPDDEIHYFSIVNSLMIVLFLTGVVAMIMLRTLHKDISTYNEMQTLEEAQEESGWKLVHGDVFRPPSFSPMLLSVLAGTGVQLLAMTCFTMVCALLGLLSPSNKGSLVTALLLIFVFMGSCAGYWSARVYKLFHGKEWKRNTVLTALLYPLIMGVIFLGTNVVVSQQGSSTTAPFTTLLSVLLLWFGVSTPLVFVGSYFGFRKETIEVPVRTNQIARHIPDQVWYTNPIFSVALGGILPFGAVCIELFFIMSAMWLHQLYFVFGFLFVVLIILVVTCAEITIVMCYFQLCNEDYRWWWRSYLSSGSSGAYLFLYSVWYYMSKLDIEGFVPTVLYFAYMSMISITFMMVTGAIGFFACLWFVRKIYGAIKVD